MERVSDEWISRTLEMAEQNSAGHGSVEILGRVLVQVLNELEVRRKAEKEQEYDKIIDDFWRNVRGAEKEHGHTDHSANEKCGAKATQERERAILPIPVKRIDGVNVETWTVKQWFRKINEELDEFKEAVLDWSNIDGDIVCGQYGDDVNIADEAADTITAITSMLEAMGIYVQARQEAQKRVNERNKERGRL